MNSLSKSQGRLVAAVFFASAAWPAGAAAEIVTLEELEALALQNQAHWEATQARGKHALAEIDVAKAERRPTFDLDASGYAAPGGEVVSVPTLDGQAVTVTASPTVEQANAFLPRARYDARIIIRAPLYDFGRTRAAIDSASTYHAATDAHEGASREAVLTNVRMAYLDWLSAYLMRDLAVRSNVEFEEQRLRVEERVREGDGPATDLDEAQYDEMQSRLEAAEAKARSLRAKRRLGSVVGTELSATSEPDVSTLEVSLGDAEAAPSSEIKALELERDAALLEAQMHRKSRAPVLAAAGQTGLAGINDRVFPMYRVGLTLAAPLWDGRRALARAEAAEARAIELAAYARVRKVELDEERQEAEANREDADGQLAIAQSLVAISDKRVERAQASYELGVGDLDAIATARNALRDAQARRLRIQIARAHAVLMLGRETGRSLDGSRETTPRF